MNDDATDNDMNDPPYRLIETSSSVKFGNDTNIEKTINIITCNIEGAKSNTTFLVSLACDNRIICIQEQFLWEFQKDFFQNCFQTMKILHVVMIQMTFFLCFSNCILVSNQDIFDSYKIWDKMWLKSPCLYA